MGPGWYTFARGMYNIIHAVLPFRQPYAISAGCFIFKLRQSSCFSGLGIYARRMMPDRAVEIGNLTNLRAVSDQFRNISAGRCNIIHAALPFRRPYAISACFIKPDRKLPRLFADAGTWFRNETLVSAASATKRECAGGRILSGGLPNESVPAEGFCPATFL